MKTEFLQFGLEIKSVTEVKQDDVDYFEINGYASISGNVDLGYDIVEAGAFNDDINVNGNKRSILWQHKWDSPVGVGVFEEDNKGLKVKMFLPKDDDFVKNRVMPQVKIKSVTGLSIGYRVQDYVYDEVNGARRLKKLQLMETSLVTFPMNEEARITAAKQILNTGNENDKIDLVIDDSVVGIIAGNNDLKCSELALNEFKTKVNEHCKSEGREEPFQKGKTLIDVRSLKGMKHRDFEKIFNNDVILSRESKKYIYEVLTRDDSGAVHGGKQSNILDALIGLNETLDNKEK